MQNLILPAYLGWALMGPAQAANHEFHPDGFVQPGSLLQVDEPLLASGSLSVRTFDRPEPGPALTPPAGSAAATTIFDPFAQSMSSNVPQVDYKEVDVTSTPAPEAQYANTDSAYKRWFVGSTFLMLGNFIRNDRNPPDFTQLNVGYRITPRNVVFLELKRSKFAWPLGIPWGPSFDAPGENYPGYVRQNIIGIAYNHFWRKGLYTGVHAMNAFQKYYNEDNQKIASGYTLFMTYRLGYQLKFFNDRFFVEPSLGLTHWPVKTNTPGAFKAKENKWPKYFAFEPGFHFGVNF